MHLPSVQHIRGVRATIGALHHTLHAIALAECDGADCQFDATPMDGEEYVASPQQLRSADGSSETWYGGAVRTADQSASGEAALVAEHGFEDKEKFLEALRARIEKLGERGEPARSQLPTVGPIQEVSHPNSSLQNSVTILSGSGEADSEDATTWNRGSSMLSAAARCFGLAIAGAKRRAGASRRWSRRRRWPVTTGSAGGSCKVGLPVVRARLHGASHGERAQQGTSRARAARARGRESRGRASQPRSVTSIDTALRPLARAHRSRANGTTGIGVGAPSPRRTCSLSSCCAGRPTARRCGGRRTCSRTWTSTSTARRGSRRAAGRRRTRHHWSTPSSTCCATSRARRRRPRASPPRRWRRTPTAMACLQARRTSAAT